MEKPVLFRWDGEVMTPVNDYARRLADELFVVGDVHPLVEQQMREQSSHGHYFARLGEMWKTLPDGLAEEFPNREHLRKHALIHTGWVNKSETVFGSNHDAVLALSMLTMADELADEYAIMEVKGKALTRWTAKSQAYKAMGKKDFMKSKYDVLGWVADKLKLPAGDIHREPGE